VDKAEDREDHAETPELIPEECLLLLPPLPPPQFRIWQPRWNRAVLWILVHMVWFRMQVPRFPSPQDYCDFMHRTRKVEQQAAKRVKFGNYLVFL
jgi:hypothetical protein